MSQGKRRQFSAEEKIRILRLHLLEGRPVSQVCEESGIHPTMFYQWQKTFFDNGTAAFDGRGRGRTQSTQQQAVERLEQRIRHKDEVLAEIAAEMVRLKKERGGDTL